MPRPRVKTPRGKPESQVTREVLQALAPFAAALELDRQNTGGMYDARGQFVRFGTPGNSDFSGMFTAGHYRGCRFDLELKREFFDPRKLRGEKREHFTRQLARLERTNRNGGVGLWVNDAAQILSVLPRVLLGAWIEFDPDGFPYLCTED